MLRAAVTAGSGDGGGTRDPAPPWARPSCGPGRAPQAGEGSRPGQWPLWGVLRPCPELPRPLSPAVLDLRPQGAGPSAGQPVRLTDSRRSGGGPPASPARSRRSEPGSQPGSRPCSHLAETWSFGPGGLGSRHGGRTPGAPSRVGSPRGSRHLPDPPPALHMPGIALPIIVLGPASPWVERAPRGIRGNVSLTVGTVPSTRGARTRRGKGGACAEGDSAGVFGVSTDDPLGGPGLGSVVLPQGPPLQG